MAIVLVWTFIHHLMKPIHGTYELGYDNSSLIVANSSMDNTIMGHELLDEPSLIHSNKMTPNETLISSIHSTSTITTMDHEVGHQFSSDDLSKHQQMPTRIVSTHALILKVVKKRRICYCTYNVNIK